MNEPAFNLFEQTPETWRARVDFLAATMRMFSSHTDPEQMVVEYGQRMRSVIPAHRMLSVTRREAPKGKYLIARNTDWTRQPNPRTERHLLPVLSGGMLEELLAQDGPQFVEEFECAADDPAREYLEGFRCLIALPVFDQGEVRNMVVFLHRDAAGLHREMVPLMVWTTNLLGRAMHALALSQQLQAANETIEHEMQTIADLQRSLLPSALPQVEHLEVAAFYQPATQAGGDYYDFFPLPNGRLGILLSDISGHGSPAAVLMAVTHTLAHTQSRPPSDPADMLRHVNHHLAARYTNDNGRFVTSFYGIFDPPTRSLHYACAGHEPPRVKRCADGSLFRLDEAQGLPLGIVDEGDYTTATVALQAGDQIIFYTDGITEARNGAGEMFGTARLDEVLANCSLSAEGLIDDVINRLDEFTGPAPYADDRTLVAARVTG
jgi:sigma-B regulation protein RsbU (phosphoserine phosphatase)